MGMGDVCVGLCVLCVFIIPPFILQSVGLFTPKWASNSTCDSIGLVYSCCSGDSNDTCGNTNGGDELDVRVLGLQATSFAVMFLAVFGICGESCCSGDDDETGWCGVIGGCCFFLYPVAGLFTFIGCMLLVPKYSGSELGYSFYLCLTSGCLILLITIVGCCCLCIAAKSQSDDDSTQAGPVQSYGGGGATTQYYGGNQGVFGQAAVIEQTAVVHDAESGNVFLFMRRMNITRLVTSIRR